MMGCEWIPPLTDALRTVGLAAVGALQVMFVAKLRAMGRRIDDVESPVSEANEEY